MFLFAPNYPDGKKTIHYNSTGVTSIQNGFKIKRP